MSMVEQTYPPLILVPVTRDVARKFIGAHHRHNLPPNMVRIAVGVESEGKLVGVATAHNPVARMLDDGYTLEVTRTCTDGTRNANSILYGAITRAAKALGFRRLYTYTLVTESGSSLKAAGWVADAELDRSKRPEGRQGWNATKRHRYEMDLFGNERTPRGPKIRWVKHLTYKSARGILPADSAGRSPEDAIRDARVAGSTHE